jgi:hypothetical protein
VNLDGIWSGFLEFVAQIIIPTWNNLIQYLPLLLALLLIVSIAGLAWYWQRNAAANRPRVPKPLPAGRKPDDMHLPGPSLWPFVAPVGLMLIAFAIVFGVIGSLANLALLGLGITIVVIGLLGWYVDANREYSHVAVSGHGAAPALEAGGPRGPGWSLAPPDGMHLPGPSAWPFLAPVGLLFMVAGLIFGPALIVGGLVMAAIASIGWLFDAGRELKDVEAHGHPTQADRDPERAWPRRLIPVYVLVGGLALLITLAPWLISLLPGSA